MQLTIANLIADREELTKQVGNTQNVITYINGLIAFMQKPDEAPQEPQKMES